MGKYRRVTLAERCQIQAFLQAGLSITKIASLLGFHKSSISRELSRNKYSKSYCYKRAENRSKLMRTRQGRKYSITGPVAEVVTSRLFSFWSPEQISGRLKLEKQSSISHESIYAFIRRNPELKSFLRRTRRRGHGRYAQRKAKWANKLHISKRPQVANERKRIGDWERDAMYLADRKQLLVFTDRKSRYTKVTPMKKLCSKWISLETKKVLKRTGKEIKTITNDNGTEFRGNESIGVPIYYCTPMKPQQRGTVENAVGLLRQFFKRTTKMASLTSDDLQLAEDYLNHRPRKTLDYQTPYEVFYGVSVALDI